MSDSKLVKTILDAAALTVLAAGLSWASKKSSKKTWPPTPAAMPWLRNVYNRDACRYLSEAVPRR